MMTEILNSIPFVLSLSKDIPRQLPHCDKFSANGSIKGRLFS